MIIFFHKMFVGMTKMFDLNSNIPSTLKEFSVMLHYTTVITRTLSTFNNLVFLRKWQAIQLSGPTRNLTTLLVASLDLIFIPLTDLTLILHPHYANMILKCIFLNTVKVIKSFLFFLF